MLAGNIANINTNRHPAAATRVGGYSSPPAPSSSSTPVIVTSNPAAGRAGGTIAIMSRRIAGTKCATPVIANIAASPTATACGQLSTWAPPSQPTSRVPSVPRTKVMMTAIADSLSSHCQDDGDTLTNKLGTVKIAGYDGVMSRDTYHHGDLKAVILAKAAGLVAERGAYGISLRELARAAGVSHAAPAHHFTDRRGLFTALA